jgi:hypothetical protein
VKLLDRWRSLNDWCVGIPKRFRQTTTSKEDIVVIKRPAYTIGQVVGPRKRTTNEANTFMCVCVCVCVCVCLNKHLGGIYNRNCNVITENIALINSAARQLLELKICGCFFFLPSVFFRKRWTTTTLYVLPFVLLLCMENSLCRNYSDLNLHMRCLVDLILALFLLVVVCSYFSQRCLCYKRCPRPTDHRTLRYPCYKHKSVV